MKFGRLLPAVSAAVALLGLAIGSARADGCNIATVLFGKVRIEIIPHKDYETGIIFGGDFDSQKFSYDKLLGRMDAVRLRSGPYDISDVNGEHCGRLENLKIDTSMTDCSSCSKEPVTLKKLNKSSYAVMNGDTVVGTINGRLPR